MQRNINIGRYTLAEIQINDKLLSKIHCVVNYNEELGWILQDGHENKLSTNGTWLYLNEEIQIFDKMIFKANHTIFQCHFSH
jgi:hypothetical protein